MWRDEPVDVYMTELRKLARLAGITSDKLLLRAFVVGLPSVVSRELRATANIEDIALAAVVERARALMSELVVHPCAAVAARRVVRRHPMAKEQVRERPAMRSPTGEKGAVTRGRPPRCYGCGGPHVVYNCPRSGDVGKVECWNCGGMGHMSRACPSKRWGRRVDKDFEARFGGRSRTVKWHWRDR